MRLYERAINAATNLGSAFAEGATTTVKKEVNESEISNKLNVLPVLGIIGGTLLIVWSMKAGKIAKEPSKVFIKVINNYYF